MRKLAGKFLFYLNVLAAICLLIAYLAPVVSPAKLLFPAFFGLAYPYFLLLNIIFLVYWIIRMRKEMLISLLVIMIGWTQLVNFLPIRFSGNKEDTRQVKFECSVMSYNVRTFDKYNWSESDNSRDGMFDLINANTDGVVCIQEFFTANRSGQRERDVRRKLKEFPYYSIYYGVKSGPNTGSGMATFSKYPIIKTSRIPFDNSLNQAVYTDLLIENDTVRVFNIHLQSISLREKNYSFIDTISLKYSNKQLSEVKDIGRRLRDAFVMRAEQAVIIHRYIEASPYPVIVAGDFNDTPVSYAYRKIKKGLNDAFRKKGKGFGNTYAGELPSFRIDYILFSDELEATSYKRIKSHYSDHFPIISTLRKYEK